MLRITVLIAFCAIFGTASATIGSDLEDDNFRMLKDQEVLDDIPQSDDDSKFFWDNNNPETLPYNSLDEWDKLKGNPPFLNEEKENDESENEVTRDKRDNKLGLFPSLFSNKKNKNKMDQMIRDRPEVPDNSKFHGSLFNDLDK